jgi:hypothetical protein
VAVGDFNGDGVPDLAVANGGSRTVSVLLGRGDGSFAAATNYAAGNYPASVAVGDFNGDGVPDLAVANFGNNTVSVLLGRGDGSFAAAIHYAAGSSPYSVAVGDFNGDGWPDLATANQNSNNVSILLNDAAWAGPHLGGGGQTRGRGGSRGVLLSPPMPPATPAPLVQELMRVDPSAIATVPPSGVPLDLVEGSWPFGGSDVYQDATPTGPAANSVTKRPTPPRATLARLTDHLFAEPESGWLWDRFADWSLSGL